MVSLLSGIKDDLVAQKVMDIEEWMATNLNGLEGVNTCRCEGT